MKISKLSNKKLEELASKIGLQVDEKTGIIFGAKNGYNSCLKIIDNTYESVLSFSISCDGEFPREDDFIDLVKEHKFLISCKVSQHSISFLIGSFLGPGLTRRKIVENIADIINAIVEFLQVNDYKNCCESCGKEEDVNEYILNGTEIIVCSSCFNTHTHAAKMQEQANKKDENIIAGIVGSFIGAIVGVIAIVIFGQLGYVASISGIIMAVCSLKGYEFLGGKLSNIGILLSSVIMVMMIYIGCKLDWAISIMSYYEIDIFSAFNNISGRYIDISDFEENLVLLYGYALIGLVPTVWNTIRSRKHANITHKMGSNI